MRHSACQSFSDAANAIYSEKLDLSVKFSGNKFGCIRDMNRCYRVLDTKIKVKNVKNKKIKKMARKKKNL